MSDEYDERWLRERLADAVPEAPPAPGRAPGARAMARRARRTALAAAGGIAASVLVVAGVAVLAGGSDDTGRDHTADRIPAAPGDGSCPAEPVDTRADDGPKRVPDGAVSVRLCRGNEASIDLPADALTTDIAELATVANGLDPRPADAICTQGLGPVYQLMFRYPDGSAVAVSGELYGCRHVTVGGVERSGADLLLARFADLLRAQREQLGPPALLDMAAPDCEPAYSAQTVGRPQEMSVAVLCVDDRGVPIPATDLAVLLADMAANTERNAGYADCIQGTIPSIVGRNAWGDRIELHAECPMSRFVVNERDHSVWTPTSPEARAIIDRLVAEAG